MASKLKVQELALQSPNGLVEKTLSLGNDGALGGFAGKSTIVSTTLASASWTGSSAPYSYSLTVSGVTTTSVQELLPSLTITSTQLQALQGANIVDAGQSANTITLYAYGSKPTVDLPIRIILRGDI